MEKEFCRVRSAKDIAISVSLVIIGGVSIALPTATSINILGFFLIFAGIILFLMLKTGYKDTASCEKYQKSEHFFAQSMRDTMSKALAKPENLDLKEEDKGNGLRLDIFYSKSTGKAYLQLFEYVPYKYEPCSRQVECEISKISKIL
ncbi:MAG: hypothetical protein IJZ70_03285 [Bacteroidales bacterium]|nr:hypothetical protein [Bacteroidales bacterium]